MNLKCFSQLNEVFAFENVNFSEYKMLIIALTGHIYRNSKQEGQRPSFVIANNSQFFNASNHTFTFLGYNNNIKI